MTVTNIDEKTNTNGLIFIVCINPEFDAIDLIDSFVDCLKKLNMINPKNKYNG